MFSSERSIESDKIKLDLNKKKHRDPYKKITGLVESTYSLLYQILHNKLILFYTGGKNASPI